MPRFPAHANCRAFLKLKTLNSSHQDDKRYLLDRESVMSLTGFVLSVQSMEVLSNESSLNIFQMLNVIHFPLLWFSKMATVWAKNFQKNSAWGRHPVWKTSVQVWESYKQLKTGSYNEKCQTTSVLESATSLAHNTGFVKDITQSNECYIKL